MCNLVNPARSPFLPIFVHALIQRLITVNFYPVFFAKLKRSLQKLEEPASLF